MCIWPIAFILHNINLQKGKKPYLLTGILPRLHNQPLCLGLMFSKTRDLNCVILEWTVPSQTADGSSAFSILPHFINDTLHLQCEMVLSILPSCFARCANQAHFIQNKRLNKLAEILDHTVSGCRCGLFPFMQITLEASMNTAGEAISRKVIRPEREKLKFDSVFGSQVPSWQCEAHTCLLNTHNTMAPSISMVLFRDAQNVSSQS